MSHSQSKLPVAGPLSTRKKPVQLRSVRTVDDILEGAAHILEAQGFERYTTNEIAARAGVSIGSLYQYFPNRDAITIALIERESQPLVEEVTVALGLASAKQGLRAMIQAAVRHQTRRPNLARILDFEQSRLSLVMPSSSNAAAVHAAVVDYLKRQFEKNPGDLQIIASDIISITRCLTDAAGRRGGADPLLLERQIEGAVDGYLTESMNTSSPPRSRRLPGVSGPP